MERLRLGLNGLLLAWMGPAFGQISPEFEKILANPGEQQMIIAAARQSAIVTENPCANAKFVIASKVAIIEPPVFDPEGRVMSGIWKQVVDYTGCDAPRTLNVLMTIAQNQRPNARPLFPGVTLADGKLQADVFLGNGMKMLVERWRDPACRSVYVVDTEVEKTELHTEPGAKGPAWSEVWTIAACERRENVQIRFVPDPRGVAYAISPAKAVKP